MSHKPMEESWMGFESMNTQACVGDESVGSIGWVIIPYPAEKLGARHAIPNIYQLKKNALQMSTMKVIVLGL